MPFLTEATVLLQVQLEIDKQDLVAGFIYAKWLKLQGHQEAFSLAIQMLESAGWTGDEREGISGGSEWCGESWG